MTGLTKANDITMATGTATPRLFHNLMDAMRREPPAGRHPLEGGQVSCTTRLRPFAKVWHFGQASFRLPKKHRTATPAEKVTIKHHLPNPLRFSSTCFRRIEMVDRGKISKC